MKSLEIDQLICIILQSRRSDFFLGVRQKTVKVDYLTFDKFEISDLHDEWIWLLLTSGRRIVRAVLTRVPRHDRVRGKKEWHPAHYELLRVYSDRQNRGGMPMLDRL